MQLYDGVILDTVDSLKGFQFRKLDVESGLAWKTLERNELILQKDSAYELGGSALPAVSLCCVTGSKGLVEDGILLYGKDLGEIRGDVPFAKIIFLEVEGLEEAEASYKAIKDLEFIKYSLHLEGYMMRASTMDRREQVRVSRSALDLGLDFTGVGNAYIKRFRESPLVRKVKIIFITEKIPQFTHLGFNARKVDDITLTMNHALNNLDMDCGSCNLREICDEVEGLKELHFKHSVVPR